MSVVRIERRYNGPPASGNGGYVCGLLAVAAGRDVLVRLRAPPPLEADLAFDANGEGVWELRDANTLFATARPTPLQLEVPPPPVYMQAVWASQHYPGFQAHPFPECFVCGPQRRRGDGLRIFPGQLETGLYAAPWLPADGLGDAGDKVRIEFHWAALDCPGYFAVSGGRRPMLLGEFQAHVDRPVRVGESCTVIGWKLGHDGRKHHAGTALFDGDGELCARAHATWIDI
jgi:hypothetical protein